MAEPQSQTLHLLREIREAVKALDLKVERGSALTDQRFDDVRTCMDNIRQALNGERVLGRYAAAEVEERREAIEMRLAALEEPG